MQKRIRSLCLLAGILLFSGNYLLPLRAETQKPLSRSALRKQVREAHTAEQYRALAEYFRGEQIRFRLKAQKEEQNLFDLRENAAVMPSKYPTPVDSATRLFQYYSWKAEEMGRRATEFDQKAEAVNGNAVTADKK